VQSSLVKDGRNRRPRARRHCGTFRRLAVLGLPVVLDRCLQLVLIGQQRARNDAVMSATLPARTAASRLGTASRGWVIVGFATREVQVATRAEATSGHSILARRRAEPRVGTMFVAVQLLSHFECVASAGRDTSIPLGT
jgi:hypothetical protein